MCCLKIFDISSSFLVLKVKIWNVCLSWTSKLGRTNQAGLWQWVFDPLFFSLYSLDRDWEFLVKSNYNLSREMPLSSVDVRNKRTPICLICIQGFSWEKEEEKVLKYKIMCVTCLLLSGPLGKSRVSFLATLPRISFFSLYKNESLYPVALSFRPCWLHLKELSKNI